MDPQQGTLGRAEDVDGEVAHGRADLDRSERSQVFAFQKAVEEGKLGPQVERVDVAVPPPVHGCGSIAHKRRGPQGAVQVQALAVAGFYVLTTGAITKLGKENGFVLQAQRPIVEVIFEGCGRVVGRIEVELGKVDLGELRNGIDRARGGACADEMVVGVVLFQHGSHLLDPGAHFGVLNGREVGLVPPLPVHQRWRCAPAGGNVAQAALEVVAGQRVGDEILGVLAGPAIDYIVGVAGPLGVGGGGEGTVVDEYQFHIHAAFFGQAHDLIELPGLEQAFGIVAQAGVGPLDTEGPGSHPHANPVAAVGAETVQPLGEIGDGTFSAPAHVDAHREVGGAVLEGEVARVFGVDADESARAGVFLDGERHCRGLQGGGGQFGGSGPVACGGGDEAGAPARLAAGLEGERVVVLIPEGRGQNLAAAGAGEAHFKINLGGVEGIGKHTVGGNFELDGFVRRGHELQGFDLQ